MIYSFAKLFFHQTLEKGKFTNILPAKLYCYMVK